MTSVAKIAANRRNACKSTGPRSRAGKLRSRQNAFRHGLAIPITADIGFSDQIEALSKALSADTNTRQDEAARLMALAEFELRRTQDAKVRVINRAADELQTAGYRDPREIAALAYSHEIETLRRLERYQRRALARRAHAFRVFNACEKLARQKGAVFRTNLFTASVWGFNVTALVHNALESNLQPLRVSWDGSNDFDVRITVELSSDRSGSIQFAIANAEVAFQVFSLVRLPDRPEVLQWCAICPKTGKRVEDLFLKESERYIGSRYALKLTYRSKLANADKGEYQSRENLTALVSVVPSDTKQSADSVGMVESQDISSQSSGASDAIPVSHESQPQQTALADADDSHPVSAIDTESGDDPNRSSKLIAKLKVADGYATEGRLEEALAEYHDYLMTCKAKHRDDGDTGVKRQLDKVMRRIADLGFKFMLNGNFEQGLRCADEMLDAHPNSSFANIYRAHAKMLLGDENEARVLYRRFAEKYHTAGRTFKPLIQEQFRALRKAGYQHPLMDEIAPIPAPPIATTAAPSPSDAADAASQTPSPANPVQAPGRSVAEFELGDRLMAKEKWDKAADTFRDILARCEATIKDKPNDSQALEVADWAVRRLGVVAFEYLLHRNVSSAIKTIEEAISHRPHWIWLKLPYSYALVLSARKTEALNIHRTYHNQLMEDGTPWGYTIRCDISALREAGYDLPILNEIEGYAIRASD